MRWVGRTVAAIMVAVLVVLAPFAVTDSASAIGWKKPVDPYPDLPSQQTIANLGGEYYQWVTNKYGPTVAAGDRVRNPVGSIGYQEMSGRVTEFLTEKGYAPPSTRSEAKVRKMKTERLIVDKPSAPGKAVNISSMPKPITAAGALTRGVAGANMFGSAFLGGFAVGGAGIQFVGQMTGTDFDGAMCGADEWVQTAYGLVSMGFGPGCQATYPSPNEDVQIGVMVNGGGVVVVRLGRTSQTSSGWTCYSWSGTLLPGWRQERLQGGVWNGTTGIGPDASGRCVGDGKPGGTHVGGGNADFMGTVQWRVANPTTGEAAEAQESSPDPMRDATCELTWADGSTTTGFVGQYRESEGFPMGVVDAACTSAFDEKQPSSGPTVYPTKIGLKSKNNDTGLKTPLLEHEVPEYNDEEKAALEDTTGKGLELWKGTESCLTWAADCSGWWEDTDNGQTTTTDYRCTFGGKRVALAQCYVYAPTFESGTEPGSETETPTINDPVTGQPVEWSGDESQNSTDPALGPTPGETCMGNWSSVANPIEWVFHPVQCALLWAFAPREAKVQTVFNEAVSKWELTMPGQIGGLVGNVFTTPSVQGCEGLHIFIPLSDFGAEWGWQDIDWHVLNACEDPGATAALWSRLIGSAVLIYFTGLGIVRRASATVNAPGLGGGGS